MLFMPWARSERKTTPLVPVSGMKPLYRMASVTVLLGTPF